MHKVKLVLFTLALSSAALATISMGAVDHELKSDPTTVRAPIETPNDKGLEGTQVVNVARAGEPPLTAFFRPPANGRLVILLHGAGADRSQLLPEARMLARHGFGFLSLDWPGQGESGGTSQWGEAERLALTRAIDWASQAPGVRPRQIGLLGFSMGSWIALEAAAADSRVYALALTGAFADAGDLIAWQGGRRGVLSSGIALLTARWHGMRYWENRSEDLIRRIGSRPVLLVAGTDDSEVPPWMTAQLYRSAGEPKSFWLAPGADHGQYAVVAPEEYERRLVELFSTAAASLPMASR
jgi:alpha-beta hydrolase superfamily lysophospholipase